MSNHISLLKRITLNLKHNVKIEPFSIHFEDGFYPVDGYYTLTKKDDTKIRAVVDSEGNFVMSFDHYRFLNIIDDVILLYHYDSYTIRAINIKDGKLLFIEKSYGIDTYDISYPMHLMFIKTSNNRWKIYSSKGDLICSNIISYKKFYDDKPKQVIYFGIRYEDKFGFLRYDKDNDCYEHTEGCCITSCSEYDNTYLPVLLGRLDIDNKIVYSYAATSGKLMYEDKNITKIVYCKHNNLYLTEMHEENGTYYVFLRPDGSILNGRKYRKAYPIVENRTFVMQENDDVYHLMDENGRMIKEDEIEIYEIKSHFKYKSYGCFSMTLARVVIKEPKNSAYVAKEVYIDKEGNIYPDIDDITKKEISF